MTTARLFILTVLAAFIPSLAHAQDTCAIQPARGFRGEHIRVRLPAGTPATTAQVTLRPMQSAPADNPQGSRAVEYTQQVANQVRADGSTSFTVHADAPLGRYYVDLMLDGKTRVSCGMLQVAVPERWNLALAAFDPSGTFDVPKRKVTRNGATIEVPSITLSLRGTGFLTDLWDDNRIYINDVRRTVTWARCPPPEPTTDQPPTDLVLYGEVLSSEQIVLCNVEVPDVHRIVRVEVSQEGVPRTVVRHFRLYWWDRMIVGSVAAAIALLSAASVLWFVHRFKKSQTTDSQLGLLQILFLDPETETYSLSKLQFYLWTFAALFGYVYLAISRLYIQGERWPDIPEGLPAVIALGAGTAVGAQIVQSTRGPKGAGSEVPNLGDFVTSGGVAAPERVQMLVWTIIGVGVFMYAVLQHGPEEIVGLDPVPTGLLYMMGLSSLGYLGGKLARGAGPIINEISIVPAESDQTLRSENAPLLPDLTAARGIAEQSAARLSATAGAAAKPALEALSAGIAAVKGASTLAAMQALVVTLAGELAKAEAAAAATASAVGRPDAPADATQAAQTAQGAAAALQDLVAAVGSSVAAMETVPVRKEFSRVIELRGRNLSDQALFSIDQTELPFRMLRPNADGKQLPEVVIREKNDPNLAIVLRLTIDAARLEEPDLRQYHVWFGTPSTKPRTFSVINLDGQRADIAFSIPPATAQKPTDTLDSKK